MGGDLPYGHEPHRASEQNRRRWRVEESPDVAVEALSASARARRGSTYADFEPGEYGVIVDPRGWLMVVRGNPASALEGLALAVGDQVWLSGPATSGELQAS